MKIRQVMLGWYGPGGSCRRLVFPGPSPGADRHRPGRPWPLLLPSLSALLPLLSLPGLRGAASGLRGTRRRPRLYVGRHRSTYSRPPLPRRCTRFRRTRRNRRTRPSRRINPSQPTSNRHISRPGRSRLRLSTPLKVPRRICAPAYPAVHAPPGELAVARGPEAIGGHESW